MSESAIFMKTLFSEESKIKIIMYPMSNKLVVTTPITSYVEKNNVKV